MTLYKTDLSTDSLLWTQFYSRLDVKRLVEEAFKSVVEMGRVVMDGLERGVDEYGRGADGMEEASRSLEEVFLS